MKLVEVDSRNIMLEGITFTSSFSLSNPHEILAIMFEVILSKIKAESKPPYFEIEP